MSAEVVVSARGLGKRYGKDTVALADLDLDIRRGEVFALLGPNGAGKTTFIGIACGLVKKTSGSVTVLGKDVERDYLATRRSIGLVPQEINFDPFFSVVEVLRFQRGYFGLRPDDAKIDELLHALDLFTKRDANTRALSGGMRRRLLIAKALVHDPPIVFLDEPTAGVDVNLRRDLWDYVRQQRARGTTFILTTHYLEEAEQLADRVGVIDRGRLLVVDETARLVDRLGQRTLRLVLQTPVTDADLPHALVAIGVTRDAEGGLVYTYSAEDRDAVTRLLAAVTASGVAIRDLSSARPSLEQVFMDLVAQKKSVASPAGSSVS